MGEPWPPLFVASCQLASFLGWHVHWMPTGLVQWDSSASHSLILYKELVNPLFALTLSAFQIKVVF